MSLLRHNKCCQCADCSDKPQQLVVKVSYPEASGTIIPAHPDGFWADVTTECSVPTHLNGVRHINLTNAGEGYTEAPEISIAGKASGFTRIVSSIESVTVTSGGAGYLSPPFVQFNGGGTELEASASAIIEGKITKITLGGSLGGYTEPPRIVVCGGTGAELTPVMTGYVDRIEVTDSGSGYDPTVKPTVTLAGGGGSGATAGQRVGRRIAVTGFNVTNPGRGYDQPPEVVVTGAGRGVQAEAIVQFGKVVRIDLLSQGEGLVESFGATLDMPTVELRRGGGVDAAAEVEIDAGVAWVSLDNSGQNYTAPPEVTISGNATAVSHLKYRLNSVKVNDGGEGYPYQPTVRILGDGGPSTATAAISGSVVAVQLFSQGRYRNEYFAQFGTRTAWPTIAFTGGGGSGAAATPVFRPVPVTAAGLGGGGSGAQGDIQEPLPGFGYSTPPAVTISGGGGSGATAEAVLEWGREQTFRLPVVTCNETIGSGHCLDTESEQYPGIPCLGCGGTIVPTGVTPAEYVRYGEILGWVARPGLALQTLAVIPSAALVLGVAAYADRVFPGEAIWVYAATEWSIGHDIAAAVLGPQREEVLYLNRFYNRIPPVAEYGFWPQPESATNAVLVPQLQQYSDRKGDPFWFITGFTIQSPGENLFFDQTEPPPWPGFGAPVVMVATTGNSVGIFGRSTPWAMLYAGEELVVAYSPPVVGAWSIQATFTQMPELEFSFEPVPGVFGDYRIASVSVTSGGETDAADGEYGLAISSLDHGYLTFPNGAFGRWYNGTLLATVTNGALVSVQVLDAGNMRGGATVTSIAFQYEDIESLEENGGSALPRMIVGSSRNQTTTTYEEPTVTASAPTTGTPAVFEVVLAEDVDAAGNPVWSVDSVTVVSGGSGYALPILLEFQVQSDNGIEAIAASAYGELPPREEPTLTIGVSGFGANAAFELTYDKISGADPDEWEIAAIEVTDGGEGHTDYAWAVFQLGEDDHESRMASGYIRTVMEKPVVSASVSSGIGAVLEAVMVESFDTYWTVSSVNILSAGGGYEDGEPVVFTGGTFPEPFAEATISVGPLGEIVAVNILWGGTFQQDTGVIESVELLDRGAYYKQPSSIIGVDVQYGGVYFDRIITETTTPLGDTPPVCIGDVSGEWERRDYPRTPPWQNGGEEWEKWREVGDQWESGAQTGCSSGGATSNLRFDRIRVCPPPTLEISIE